MATKLYVGNLPFNTGEAELEALFAQAGEVAPLEDVDDAQRAQGGPTADALEIAPVGEIAASLVGPHVAAVGQEDHHRHEAVTA